MSDRLTTAIINLSNYAHNFAQIRKNLNDGVKIMAIVKANAYGHGIVEIANAAIINGASYIGVVSLGELKSIRRAGNAAPVLLLNYIDPDSMDEAVDLDGTITVMDEQAVSALQMAAASKDKVIRVHIKIDTGMHRAGCEPGNICNIAQKVLASKNLVLEGIFTHFAESEALDTTFTLLQLSTFERCIEQLKALGINPALIHCANSAATIALPQTHFSMVRPGIITYGLNPFEPTHPKHKYIAENFKQVLSLKTQIIYIRDIAPGETVGYNRRWKAEHKSKIALLPVGYGDGFRRTPHNAGRVLVGGKYAPTIGTVAMDQTVIDITNIKGLSVGDEAVLLGSQKGSAITADDIAKAYQTINYEVVTSLADRISRIYV